MVKKFSTPKSACNKNSNQGFFSIMYYNSSRASFCLLIFGIISAIFSGALQPVVSVLFGKITNVFAFYLQGQYTSQQFKILARSYSLYFVYLALFMFVVIYIYVSVFVYCGGRIVSSIKMNYLVSLLGKSITWHDSYGPGELCVPISSDADSIQSAISEKLPIIIKDISTFISGFTVSFYISWRLALSIVFAAPAISATVFVSNFLFSKYTTKEAILLSKSNNIVQDSLASIRTVHAFNFQKKFEELYNYNLDKTKNYSKNKILSSSISSGILLFLLYCTYSLAFFVGGKLFTLKMITVGDIVGVSSSVIVSSFALANLASNVQSFLQATVLLKKMSEKMNKYPRCNINTEITKITEKEYKKTESINGDIEFSEIVFSYPNRKDIHVLQNFNLKILKNSNVAFVGPSGSGKSTIVGLLERFYKPNSGHITIDGVNIKNFNKSDIRQSIGYVSQQPVLFNATIAENVAYGLIGTIYEDLHIEEKMSKIKKACIEANAHEFIKEMPNGYHTNVGDKGFLLSGGQKQRIAIARAIVKDPKILLLDEATAALDTKSEKLVQSALDLAKLNRTTITIAHRLSTIKDCDLIVVMSKGMIIEKGKHEELLNNPEGTYSKLIKAQKLDQIENNDNCLELTTKKAYESSLRNSNKFEKGQESIIEKTESLDVEGKPTKPYGIFKIIYTLYLLNRSEKIYYVSGILGSAILGFSYPIFSILYSRMLAQFYSYGETAMLVANFWALMFIVFAFYLFVGAFFETFGFMTLSERLGNKLKKIYFTEYLERKVVFFDDENNSATALSSKISANSQTIKSMAGMTCASILQGTFNLIGSIAVSMFYGWKLSLIVVCTLPVLLYSGYIQINITRKSQEKNKAMNFRLSQIASEAIMDIKTVVSLNKQKTVIKKYSSALKIPLQNNTRNALFTSAVYAFSQCLTNLISAITFWYASVLFVSDNYQLEQTNAIFIALVLGTNNVSKLFAYAPELSKAKQAANDFFNNIVSRNDGLKRKSTKELSGKIQFKNIEFSYPSKQDQKILKGINFTASPGEFIALVGPSGCGKSTTISLIENFYNSNKGAINIDDHNILDYNIKELRENISLVSQEPCLYDMSIKENILFGMSHTKRRNINDEYVEEICKGCNIHDFIMSLPKKYDTNLGTTGGQLSGGQKQRIAIARALIRNPKILLLDEATSALDAESEKIVQETINKNRNEKTIISVAHRLSTIQKADLILVFKDGKIVERGKHNSLLQQRGLYYEMVEDQNLNKI